MSWKPFAIVATFPTVEEAHLAKNLLEVHGIPAIVEEHVPKVAVHLSGTGVRLLVEPGKASRVRKLLPNKNRLVDAGPEPSDGGIAPVIAGGGPEPGLDGPPGPSLGAIVVLLTLALALALAWILFTLFVF